MDPETFMLPQHGLRKIPRQSLPYGNSVDADLLMLTLFSLQVTVENLPQPNSKWNFIPYRGPE